MNLTQSQPIGGQAQVIPGHDAADVFRFGSEDNADRAAGGSEEFEYPGQIGAAGFESARQTPGDLARPEILNPAGDRAGGMASR
ncbi:MAG: hypothetical protein ACYDH3_06505, partial [Candidatus Aminicenantales bacterium]